MSAALDETRDVPEDERRDPVEELAEEFVARLRRGEAPTIAEYTARHPELAAGIEELFPTLWLVERAKQETHPLGAAPEPAGEAPAQLGDFRIVREVGRGGMGVVYEAIQESLGRRVALKLLPRAAALTPRAAERFRREAHAAAALHHTNIVQVFGVGAQEGLLYYVMQFVEGRSLEELLERGEAPLEPRRAAHIAAQAAAALDHAHGAGVLHRDVKPANVLLDAQGAAWLTDFGLAKLLGEEDGLTETGDVLGTVRYLPPERLEGIADERGDVYGLGLVLYELVTGARAFAATERASLLRAIREVGPPAPGALRPGLPRDLETIVLKAIARDPRDRYRTARALAEDLERWLEDRPIAARRASALERGWRWCRRNRAVASLAGVAVASLLAAASAGWVGYLATTEALARESARRSEAEAATRRAEENAQLSLEALEGIFEALAGDDRLGPSRRGPFADEQEEEAKLLQTVLAFYDAYAARNQTDPRLQLEAARALRRVGVLQRRLGAPQEAERAFASALERLEGLRAAAPREPVFALELAVTLLDAARRDGAATARGARGAEEPEGEEPLGEPPTRDPSADERRTRRALELLLELAGGASPPRPELVAAARCRHAVALARIGRLDDARAELEAAGALAAQLTRQRPSGGRGEGEARRLSEQERERAFALLMLASEAARAREALADALLTGGRPADALALLQQALSEAGRTRGRGRGAIPRLLERIAACHRALGDEAAATEAERLADEARRGRPGGRSGGRRTRARPE